MSNRNARPLKIFTWHVHGSYLYYLSHIPHEIYVPYDEGRSPGYAGRTDSYRWPERLIQIPKDQVCRSQFDCILFQSHQNYLHDQFEVLSEQQRRLPKLFLEHDPPRGHPTDTQHPVQSSDVMLVHVTGFNQLMWDTGVTPTCVIEHGVKVPEGVTYAGDMRRGIVVVNNILQRGRRLGSDVWEKASQALPLDLVGMGWQEAGGIGEIGHADLPAFMSRYRFFFNPIRYTSMGLSVCEAMATGLPIVGFATTELATVISNGQSGFLSTRFDDLTASMEALLNDAGLAHQLGSEAKRIAQERFGMARFVHEWNQLLKDVSGVKRALL